MKSILIGYGYWGKIVGAYIRQSGFFELEAVCDPHLKGSEKFEDVIKNSNIECAFVCVPLEEHYRVVSALLETGGLHVFCEKPLCRSLQDTQRLYKKAELKGKVLFTDYIYTMSPSIRYIKNHMSLLGNVEYVRMSIRQFGRFYPDGSVYEVIGVHMVSAFVYLFGMAEKEAAVTKVDTIGRSSGGSAETGIIYFRAGKIRGRIECSLVSDLKERRIEMMCQDGIIVFDMMDKNTVKIIRHEKDGVQKRQQILAEKQFDESNNLQYVMESFYDAVQNGNAENQEISLKTAVFMEQIAAFEVLTRKRPSRQI